MTWPRIFHGADYLPESQRNLTPEPIPVKAGLVLRYEVFNDGGEWKCDCQIHNNPSSQDLNQAFGIIKDLAEDHLSRPTPVVQEVVTTDPGSSETPS